MDGFSVEAIISFPGKAFQTIIYAIQICKYFYYLIRIYIFFKVFSIDFSEEPRKFLKEGSLPSLHMPQRSCSQPKKPSRRPPVSLQSIFMIYGQEKVNVKNLSFFFLPKYRLRLRCRSGKIITSVYKTFIWDKP